MDNLWILALDFVFLCLLAYYLINNLQWYNYSLARVLTKHHKPLWHFAFFILPIVFYCVCALTQWKGYFYFVFFPIYFLGLMFWIFKLDKPLKWTGRVWRFWGIFILFVLADFALRLSYGEVAGSFIFAFIFAILFSNTLEILLFRHYKKLALEKITAMTQLKIILITASYGKTSIKNYLHQILKARFMSYATPRSVNTLKGIIADINQNLEPQCEFYIVEAGARERGDIAEIAEFLNPQFVIIGKIGPQHLEYFKTLGNIIDTKFEALRSKRLQYALIESSNPTPSNPLKITLASPVQNIRATLEGTSFEVAFDGKFYPFETKVLGSFNAHNIALCIQMANAVGMNLQEITHRIRRLEGVEHRLSKSEVGGKVILDDSFNGNIEGMKEAIRISSEYQGRKVIVTPGVIESTDEINIELAKAIDQVFDLAIITGELNSKLLSTHIRKAQKIILKDKSTMENTLKASLKDGDLVLFANDAPNYI